MTIFVFDAIEYKKLFLGTVKDLVPSLQADASEASASVLQMIDAFLQSIDVMQRIDVDRQRQAAAQLEPAEITEIAHYAFSLLLEIANSAAAKGMQKEMMLLYRLSLPIVVWLKRHHGEIKILDIVVNAIGSYANELQDNTELESLCQLVTDVVSIVSADIRQDLEATNPARPWRILNLNWGIVATRSHNPVLMQQVFEQLIENIPADAKQFFHEGMQQMDIIGYPQPVRDVMEAFSQQFGNQASLH
ncbi:MAG: hypothetical protein OEY43_01875 [Gammaproteobacteria bacterium]|nr:hypothetical protein [Gammaproteobacteria bacterium]